MSTKASEEGRHGVERKRTAEEANGRLGGRSPSNKDPQRRHVRREERFLRSIIYDAGAKNRYLADFAPGSEARAKSETVLSSMEWRCSISSKAKLHELGGAKRIRAQGGCPGTNCRRRTQRSAKSHGELKASIDPWVSEWGNPLRRTLSTV